MKNSDNYPCWIPSFVKLCASTRPSTACYAKCSMTSPYQLHYLLHPRTARLSSPKATMSCHLQLSARWIHQCGEILLFGIHLGGATRKGLLHKHSKRTRAAKRLIMASVWLAKGPKVLTNHLELVDIDVSENR